MNYQEYVRLNCATGQFDAGRSYKFDVVPDGLDIYFNELAPRLFQHVLLAPCGDALVGQALHECQPDFYRSEYRFGPGDRFTIFHDVAGPRKGYSIASVYTRKTPN